MLVPLMAWDIDPEGAAVGVTPEVAAADPMAVGVAVMDMPAGRLMAPVQTALKGQQATLPD